MVASKHRPKSTLRIWLSPKLLGSEERISYTGPRLSTYDENALMAILALLDDKFNRYGTAVEGHENLHVQRPPLACPAPHGPHRTRGADYSA